MRGNSLVRRAGPPSHALEMARSLLDALPDPSCLLGTSGRMVHANGLMRRVLLSDYALMIREAIHAAQRRMDEAADRQAREAIEHVQAGSAELTVHLRRVTAAPGDAEDLVLVLLRSPVDGDGPVSDTVLRERFGLTSREREVARLIARGLPKRDIALRLGISPHTVARHSERVLRKLGVPNRASVAHVLMG